MVVKGLKITPLVLEDELSNLTGVQALPTVLGARSGIVVHQFGHKAGILPHGQGLPVLMQ